VGPGRIEEFAKGCHGTNGSNGTHSNRLPEATAAAMGSLPSWENYPTALIAAEVLFSLAQGDQDELLRDGCAESLQTRFGAKYWMMDGGSEKVLTVALEALLAKVDWSTIAQHVAAFAAASKAE
jgi:hypothetical protein